jgi:excisionase family DNA binding protein
MSDANLRESDATLREQWVGTEEAARLLCVSVRTVQKRVREGKLTAKQDGRRLLVCVTLREIDANLREPDLLHTSAQGTDALIVQQQSEIQFLRAELDRRATEIARHQQSELNLQQLMAMDRRELSELREKVRLLSPAPPEPTPEATSATQETESRPVGLSEGENNSANIVSIEPRPARRWWQLWRRG